MYIYYIIYINIHFAVSNACEKNKVSVVINFKEVCMPMAHMRGCSNHFFFIPVSESGPEERVRLLRFWPDQYLKLQQYF